MYSYTYDSITGGLLLNSSPTGFSKEPRPVYAPELDVLGFDKYWRYNKQTEKPYMWAEANNYYYRGTLVAKLKGGNVYTAPDILFPFICKSYKETPDSKPEEKVVYELPYNCPMFADKKGNEFSLLSPEPPGISLRPVDIDAMVEANRDIVDIIEQTTVKKILAIYTKYKDKLDCFHVAFSGGKDSCVLLDLVKKALPRGSFVVVFGDTGMEFPDTYDVVNKTELQCMNDEIPFYKAKSHFEPIKSWKLFGPPSRTLRWCCSVHKSAPQTLELRKRLYEITGKCDYTGLAFVGVRAQESATRSEYDYFSNGKKVKGQLTHNSILEWTSAEIWLYMYKNRIIINDAYRKGSARVGCICCPMGGGKAGYIEHSNYSDIMNRYFDYISRSNERANIDVKEYIMSGGWSARKNGRDLSDNPSHCTERNIDGYLTIDVETPSSDWHEWIKTLNLPDKAYTVVKTNTGYNAKLKINHEKEDLLLSRLFRQVFHRAAYCIGCRVCEANCPHGAIQFVDGRVSITNCIQCHKCHEIDSGCLLYHSLRHPQGGGIKLGTTLNTMSNHAPKTEWLTDFFERKDDFFVENSLNKKNQLGPFCRFLRDSMLIDKANHITKFTELVSTLGWDTDTAQALILINLAGGNPQIAWYILNLELMRSYPKRDVIEMLLASGVALSKAGKFDAHESICYAFKRLVETPLGTSLHWGHITEDGDLVRTKCLIDDPRVVLYGLFRFAEKCNNYKEFTLATLLNDSIDRDGISPTRIFGLDREDMVPILLGLSAKYPDFITASFTHDLEKITLASDQKSQDVLDLFKEDF